ncbi:hypothetical protein B0T22DRAFT_539592, partial [Podospora appendiculata]
VDGRTSAICTGITTTTTTTTATTKPKQRYLTTCLGTFLPSSASAPATRKQALQDKTSIPYLLRTGICKQHCLGCFGPSCWTPQRGGWCLHRYLIVRIHSTRVECGDAAAPGSFFHVPSSLPPFPILDVPFLQQAEVLCIATTHTPGPSFLHVDLPVAVSPFLAVGHRLLPCHWPQNNYCCNTAYYREIARSPTSLHSLAPFPQHPATNPTPRQGSLFLCLFGFHAGRSIGLRSWLHRCCWQHCNGCWAFS